MFLVTFPSKSNFPKIFLRNSSPLQSPMKNNARKTYLGNATYFIFLLDCCIADPVSLFTLFSLFAEPRVGKGRAKRLEEDARRLAQWPKHNLSPGRPTAVAAAITTPQCSPNAAAARTFQVNLMYIYRTKVAGGQVSTS